MDPDAALARIRELVAQSDGLHEDDYGTGDVIAMLEEMATTIQGLDEWLSKGGYPPAPWFFDFPELLKALEASK